MTDSELQSKAQDFLQRSSNWYKAIVNRIDNDVMAYSGQFWTPELIKEWHRDKRPKETWNLWKMFGNAVSSPFNQSPYHIEIDDKSQEAVSKIQDAIDRFEADTDIRSNLVEWINNAAIGGVGLIAVSFDDPVEGSTWAEPKIELIDDIRQAALDPCISKTDGSDAEEGAIVNYISLNQAKRQYGDDVVGVGFPQTVPTMCNIGDQWVMKEGMIQLVNYYWKDTDGRVMFAQLCGNKIVKKPAKLPISIIPIVRTTGYKVRNEERKIDYIGIVRATFSLQLGANIGYSTLLERLNRSPKANFMMPVGALENLERYYENLHLDESVVCLYNGTVAPTPIVEQFQTQDLRETIMQAGTLMSQTLGIPMTGIEGINFNDKTATEVIMQQTNAVSNVGCFYNAAYKGIRTIGRILLENFGAPGLTFKLMQGPDVITKNMKRRQELSMIATVLPDSMKPLLAKYMASTISDDLGRNLENDITANLPVDLKLVSQEPADPQAVHVLNQMKATMDKAMTELSASKQQNVELQNQINALTLQLANTKTHELVDLKKFQIAETNKMAIEQAKLEQQGVKIDADAQAATAKMANEAAKAEIERQKIAGDVVKTNLEAEKLMLDAKKTQMETLNGGFPSA
jgi:hypothetical protein